MKRYVGLLLVLALGLYLATRRDRGGVEVETSAPQGEEETSVAMPPAGETAALPAELPVAAPPPEPLPAEAVEALSPQDRADQETFQVNTAAVFDERELLESIPFPDVEEYEEPTVEEGESEH